MATSEHQSQTTVGVGTPGDKTLDLLKSDLAKFLTQMAVLIEELSGIKTRLDRIEGTLREIALGMGVTPK